MMSSEENTEEIDETIKQYFSTEQWDTLSNYEKISYSNARKNFEMLKSLGLNPKAPSFMQRGIKNEDTLEEEGESDDDEKEVSAADEKMPAHIEKFVAKSTPEASLRAEFSTGAIFEGLKIPNKKDASIKEERRIHEYSNGFMERYPRRAARKCYKEEDLEDDDEEEDVVRGKRDKDYDSKDDDEEDSFDELDNDDNSSDNRSRKRKRKEGRKAVVEAPLLPNSMTWVPDKRSGYKKTYVWKQRSLGSLPLCLTFAPSNADKGIVGVWTECWLAADLVFGPYEGRVFIHSDEDKDTKSYHVWQKQEQFSGYDGSDDRASNWLGYVSYSEANQNLIAFQYNKKIYYRTFKPILPHTELLVWYADDYDRDVSLSVSSEQTPKSNTHKNQVVDLCDEPAIKCNNQDVKPDQVVDLCDEPATESSECNNQGVKPDQVVDLCDEPASESSKCIKQQVDSDDKPTEESNMNIDQDASLSVKQEEAKSVEPKSTIEELKCRPCSAYFSDADTLYRHKEDHKRLKAEAVRKFKCPLCAFSHNNRGIFNHHKWMHSQKPKFTTCRQCNMPIKKKATLSTHLSVHSGLKRLTCSLCPNMFYKPSQLLDHNRSAHWQLKPSSDDELSS